MQQSIFWYQSRHIPEIFFLQLLMYTARSPSSIFVERVNKLAANPDDNEPLVETYGFKQTKLPRRLERAVG